MRKTIPITLLITVLAITGCKPTAQLSKRYKNLTVLPNDTFIKENIAVSAYIIEKEKAETTKKTIFDLSPRAQAALLQELAKKDSTTDKYLTNAANPFTAKSAKSEEIIDYSNFEKRLVISIRNQSHYPGNRIAKITVRLNLDNKLKFTSCNKLTTEYQTLDLAKVNYTQTRNAEFTGNISAELGADGKATAGIAEVGASGKGTASAGGTLSSSNSLAEEVLLKQRMVVLNAALTPTELSMYQDGASGIDLTGNILADVTMAMESELKADKTYTFAKVYKDGKFNEAKEIKVGSKIYIYPNVSADLECKVSFEADFRSITKGGKTISEADDAVTMYYGKGNEVTVTIPRLKLLPKIWSIGVRRNDAVIPLSIKASGSGGELLFDNFTEGKELLAFIQDMLAHKGQNPLPAGLTIAEDGTVTIAIDTIFKIEVPKDVTSDMLVIKDMRIKEIMPAK